MLFTGIAISGSIGTGAAVIIPGIYSEVTDGRNPENERIIESIKKIPDKTVLITEFLVPAMLYSVDTEKIAAIICTSGTPEAHSALLARSLNIPAVFGTDGKILEEAENGDEVIVDGQSGTVIVRPTEIEKKKYKDLQKARDKEEKRHRLLHGKSTKTADGRILKIYSNVNFTRDSFASAENDAEGIGLCRSEYCFENVRTLPDEETQMKVYKSIIAPMGRREVTIRTFDAGESPNPTVTVPGTYANPALGMRGIRQSLNDELSAFKTQIRAILRAGYGCNIRIMLPMISEIEELKYAKSIIERTATELDGENLKRAKNYKVGIMIETPAAAVFSDEFAKECDFFEIGTSDLTQYITAADRNSIELSTTCSVFNPSVIRLIKHTAANGFDAGIPVGLCGGFAAKPEIIPLVLAFGIDHFTVSPTDILPLRESISRWNTREARTVTLKTLSLKTEREIRNFLKKCIK